jgi:hypothetical protein
MSIFLGRISESFTMACFNKFIFATLLLVGIPSIALAQRASVFDVPRDENLVNGATFSLIAKANRSYVCGIAPRSFIGGDPNVFLVTTVTSSSGASIAGTLPASESDAIRYGNFLGISLTPSEAIQRNNLVFFTAPNGETETGTYKLTIGISGETEVTNLSVECAETSIVCNFNTFANEFNFLEVTSLGTRNVTAKLSTLDFNGELTTSDTKVFPAGLRGDFDIHSLAGSSKFGSLFIQPINSVPLIDGFANPKVSFYQDGELTSSVPCGSSAVGLPPPS